VGNPFDDDKFGYDEKTPPVSDPPQARIDREQLASHAKRLTVLEARLSALEEQPGVDRMLRQWRLFRKYLVTWLREQPGQDDQERFLRQWRRLRKYLAIWMRED
jgi:hypothetical protein